MAKIKAVIEKLDVEIEQPEQGIYVIRLQNADATEVVGVLSNLISGGGGAAAPTQPTRRGVGGRTTGLGGLGGTRGVGGETGTLGGVGQSVGGQIQRETPSGGGISAVAAEGIRITAD